jgi:hypothetical protein
MMNRYYAAQRNAMRLKVIACNVFVREVSLLAAGADAVLDISYLPQGLHNYPDILRRHIQEAVDAAEETPPEPQDLAEPPEPFAGIVLVFGLCSLALCGVRSRRIPLILPRSHDCIGILLGSSRRYREEFAENPGTYWFSPGWIEQSAFPCGRGMETMRERYARRYGEENAEFLVDTERESLRAYSRAALVSWPELDRSRYHEHARRIAADFDWRFEEVPGRKDLLQRVLNGIWNQDDVAVAQPGQTFALGQDHEVVRTVDPGEETPT